MDLTFYALDAHHGTLDPAFAGNAAAVVQWAYARWEGWLPRENLEKAMGSAKNKIEKKKKNMWNAVSGPMTAIVATMERLHSV